MRIVLGDALTVLTSVPDESVDAVVCDPPYAIRTNGDPTAAFRVETSTPDAACADCTKPTDSGFSLCSRCLRGHEVAGFARAGMLGQQSANWHDRATHSRGYADNDPRLFGRWCLLWLQECHRVLKPGGHLVAFGGTRTWHRLAVAAEDAGFEIRDSFAWLYGTGVPKSLDVDAALSKRTESNDADLDQPHDLPHTGRGCTESDRPRAAGRGTAVKPAHEPIVLARKPLERTVVRNVATYGTGALNIDTARLSGGRWPTNVFLDHTQADGLDRVSDRATRFFWVAKPGGHERVKVDGVTHPTVKPLALMRELVRLVTPLGGTVLDPFAGSGTTVEACLAENRSCVAIEREAEYLPLIEERIRRQTDPTTMPEAPGLEWTLFGAAAQR